MRVFLVCSPYCAFKGLCRRNVDHNEGKNSTKTSFVVQLWHVQIHFRVTSKLFLGWTAKGLGTDMGQGLSDYLK